MDTVYTNFLKITFCGNGVVGIHPILWNRNRVGEVDGPFGTGLDFFFFGGGGLFRNWCRAMVL